MEVACQPIFGRLVALNKRNHKRPWESCTNLENEGEGEMPKKNTAAFGIYTNQGTLETALDGLRQAGFRSTDVSLLRPENVGTKDLAHVKATKAPEGAATGAASGGVIGGALGWLAGI